jgi:hypothetical protein
MNFFMLVIRMTISYVIEVGLFLFKKLQFFLLRVNFKYLNGPLNCHDRDIYQIENFVVNTPKLLTIKKDAKYDHFLFYSKHYTHSVPSKYHCLTVSF